MTSFDLEPSSDTELPKREREVLEILYTVGDASVADVKVRLSGEPSYSATRMLLQRLQRKQRINYRQDGARYIYSPRTPKAAAGTAALVNLVRTFFGGSATSTFDALLGVSADQLSEDELNELEELVRRQRQARSTKKGSRSGRSKR